MESKLDAKRVSNFLDLINMYVGVYFDKYLGFGDYDYFKSAYSGLQARLVLFDTRDQSTVLGFAEKFDCLEKISKHPDEKTKKEWALSKFGFYYVIASSVLRLKENQCAKFVELMFLRENLLKLTKRYNDLTGLQRDLLNQTNLDRISAFGRTCHDQKGINEMGYEDFSFTGQLNDFELEEYIIKISKSSKTKSITNKIEELDRLINQHCDHLEDVFSSKA